MIPKVDSEEKEIAFDGNYNQSTTNFYSSVPLSQTHPHRNLKARTSLVRYSDSDDGGSDRPIDENLICAAPMLTTRRAEVCACDSVSWRNVRLT